MTVYALVKLPNAIPIDSETDLEAVRAAVANGRAMAEIFGGRREDIRPELVEISHALVEHENQEAGAEGNVVVNFGVLDQLRRWAEAGCQLFTGPQCEPYLGPIIDSGFPEVDE